MHLCKDKDRQAALPTQVSSIQNKFPLGNSVKMEEQQRTAEDRFTNLMLTVAL